MIPQILQRLEKLEAVCSELEQRISEVSLNLQQLREQLQVQTPDRDCNKQSSPAKFAGQLGCDPAKDKY